MAIQYRINLLPLFLFVIAIAGIDNSLASDWSQDLHFKAGGFSYKGDTNRKNLNSLGAVADLNYLERANLQVGYDQLTLNQSQNQRLNQRQYSLAGNLYQYMDLLKGRTGLHLSSYTITSTSFDTTSSYSGGLSYLTYSRRFYLDIFYTQSKYQHRFNTRGYSLVNQTNASLEFTPFFQSSWLSLQLFTQSNDDDLLFTERLYSMHVEWTQFFYKTGSLIPNKLIAGVQLGEQRYLVSQRLNSINNSLDTQTGGYWLGLIWQLNDHFNGGIDTGYYRFLDDLDATYTAIYYGLHLQIEW